MSDFWIKFDEDKAKSKNLKEWIKQRRRPEQKNYNSFPCLDTTDSGSQPRCRGGVLVVPPAIGFQWSFGLFFNKGSGKHWNNLLRVPRDKKGWEALVYEMSYFIDCCNGTEEVIFFNKELNKIWFIFFFWHTPNNHKLDIGHVGQ